MNQLIRMQPVRGELNSSKIFDKYLGMSLFLVKVDLKDVTVLKNALLQSYSSNILPAFQEHLF